MGNFLERKKYHFCYKVVNIHTGEFYFGVHSTSNLDDGYLGSGRRIVRSVKKYGKESFKLEILEFLPSRELLLKREREIVTEGVLTNPMCLNLQLGGSSGFDYIVMHRKEDPVYDVKWRELQSKKMKKLHREGKVVPFDWTGRKHREETKVKIGKANSIKQKGEGNSQFGTCWITDGNSSKKIKKSDPIPRGWKYGRRIK